MRRKEISTSRKIISIVFLALSGPICLVHRFLNSNPPEPVHPFFFRPDIVIDKQWVVADLGEVFSHIFVIFAMWLVVKGIHPIIYILVSVKLIIYLIDLAHYLLYFRQSEYVVFVQGLIYLAAGIKIFNKYASPNSNEKTS